MATSTLHRRPSFTKDNEATPSAPSSGNNVLSRMDSGQQLQSATSSSSSSSMTSSSIIGSPAPSSEAKVRKSTSFSAALDTASKQSSVVDLEAMAPRVLVDNHHGENDNKSSARQSTKKVIGGSFNDKLKKTPRSRYLGKALSASSSVNRTRERFFWIFLVAVASMVSSLYCSSNPYGMLADLIDQEEKMINLMMGVPVPQADATTATEGEGEGEEEEDSGNADVRDQRYQLAYDQSYGFFDNISEDDWKYRQEMASEEKSSTGGRRTDQQPAFYVYSFQPFFSCPHSRRVGTRFLCDVHRINNIVEQDKTGVTRRLRQPDDHCLVYTFGHNDEMSTEEQLQGIVQKTGAGCNIHVFDPYPTRLTDAFFKTNNIQHHEWGLCEDARAPMGGIKIKGQLYMTLAKTMEKLGHKDKVIDVLTLNCNGCEWEMIPDLLAMENRIVQLVVKTHDLANPPLRTYDFFTHLYRAGYVLLHKEVKDQRGGVIQSTIKGAQWSFLKLDPLFLRPDGVPATEPDAEEPILIGSKEANEEEQPRVWDPLSRRKTEPDPELVLPPKQDAPPPVEETPPPPPQEETPPPPPQEKIPHPPIEEAAAAAPPEENAAPPENPPPELPAEGGDDGAASDPPPEVQAA